MDLAEIARQLATLDPIERAAAFNDLQGGFDRLLGLCFVSVSEEQVVATLRVEARHLQPYGLTHGGVYAALGESLCSVGAALSVIQQGKNAVGADNHTRFHRPSRAGALLTATASAAGQEEGPARRIWRCEIRDEDARLCATSTVTVAVLDPGRSIGGERLKLEGLGGA
jgi:1,4-dihydroxy-2-naphthoyl-CoA hydrolase